MSTTCSSVSCRGRSTALVTVRSTALICLLLLWAGSSWALCTLSTASPSVTICTPASGSTVGSAVQISAGTTDTARTVIEMKIYLDFGSASVFSTTAGSFTTTLTMSPGTHHITIKAWDGSASPFSAAESFTVTASPTVVVAPASATVPQGSQQIYSATENGSGITAGWSVSGNLGAFSGNVFTASATASGSGTITATAPDGTTGTTGVTVSAVPVVVMPNPVTLVQGESQPFTASVSPVTWSAPGTAGSIDPNVGVFTAATSFTGTVVVTATNSSGGTGTANVNVVPLTISPNSVSVVQGQTQNFTANAPVNIWSATAGGVASGSGGSCPTTTCGVFTAGTSSGTVTITATEASPPGTASVTANATVSVTTLALSPNLVSTGESQTQTFTANAPITNWSWTCGNVVASGSNPAVGVFTAPASIPSGGSCTITATDSGGATATATDNITAPAAPSGVNYTTWKGDNQRTGQQQQETALTPANVKSGSFGLQFTDTVDGQVYAQPLYLSNVTVNGSPHNVVYVATEHDSVFAFDADAAGPPLWQTSLIMNGGSSVPASKIQSTISTEVGITGTPVIDVSGGVNDGVLYVVAQTLEGGNYITRLHGLDVTTGVDVPGSPAVISGKYQGYTFVPKAQLNRPALLLSNHTVYIAFGPSDGDRPGVNISWNGWIFAYDASTFAQKGVWCSTPLTNGKGGIWGGGGGMAADPAGNIYAATGNGDWNGTTQFSMSWVKLDPLLNNDASGNVLDFWTPYNESSLSAADHDLGSASPVLVTNASTVHPNELIGCGKPTPVYVVDADNMGGFNSGADSQIVQSLANVVGGTSGTQSDDHCFMTPAYFNGNVYFIGNNDVVKMFSLDPTAGTLSTSAVSKGTFDFVFPGGQPVVSSNGSSNGIVWAVDAAGSPALHAWNASNVSTEIYRSPSLGSFAKWNVPTVANGKVYVGSKGKLSVFGLL